MQKKYRDWVVIAIGVLELKALLFLWGYSQFDFQKFPDETWYSIWSRWDSLHYQRIAQHFYTRADLSEQDFHFLSHFPPGYSILMSVIHSAGPSLVVAGLIISITAAVVASCVLFELVHQDFNNRPAAFRAVVFMNIFPTAYFTNVPYSDSLYLALALVAFYFTRVSKHFNAAGFMIALAIFTRVVGIMLMPAVALALLEKYRQKELSFKQMGILLFPIAGFVLYLYLNYISYGNPLFFLQDSASQSHTVKLGFMPFREAVTTLLAFCEQPLTLANDSFFRMTTGWNSAFVLLTTFACVCFIRRLPLIYSVYAFSYLFFISSMTWGLSNARYVFAIFPLFVGLGLINNRVISLTVMSAFLPLLFYFSRMLVLGDWAF
ncbi:MAG: glycosyltransferase family 39 protein [Methylococcales bacterium]